MPTVRRNSTTSLNQEEMRLNLLDALYHLRSARQEAREGRLFVASGTLRTVGMKLAFLFTPENRAYITEMVSDMDEFISVLRDIRDMYGQAHEGILHVPGPFHRGANPMTNSIGTLTRDIESVYTLLFNSRPPRG